MNPTDHELRVENPTETFDRKAWHPLGDPHPDFRMFAGPRHWVEIKDKFGFTGLAEVAFCRPPGGCSWELEFAFFEILFPVRHDIALWRIYEGTGDEYKVPA